MVDTFPRKKRITKVIGNVKKIISFCLFEEKTLYLRGRITIRHVHFGIGRIALKQQKNMKLKELTFKNFRNFEEYHVALGRKTTVFIGRNGMGKTNLIEGMVQSLSFIFSKQRDTPQYEFIRSTDQGVKTFKTTDPRYVNGDYAYPLSISAVGAIETEEGGEVPLEWQFEQEAKKSGLKDSKFRAAYHFFLGVL